MQAFVPVWAHRGLVPSGPEGRQAGRGAGRLLRKQDEPKLASGGPVVFTAPRAPCLISRPEEGLTVCVGRGSFFFLKREMLFLEARQQSATASRWPGQAAGPFRPQEGPGAKHLSPRSIVPQPKSGSCYSERAGQGAVGRWWARAAAGECTGTLGTEAQPGPGPLSGGGRERLPLRPGPRVHSSLLPASCFCMVWT